MDALSKKIKRNLKKTRICYVIAFIIFIVQFLLDLTINFATIISNKIKISFVLIAFSDWTWWSALIWIISSFFFGIFAEKNFVVKPPSFVGFMDKNVYTYPKTTLVITMTVALILSDPIITALTCFLLGQKGTYGLSIIPAILGHIFLIIAYVNVIKFNNRINNKEKEQKRRTDKANLLLSKTGKMFVIKYYNQLKTQNTIDIIDIIQENYSETTKTNRISSAKKIFSSNLQTEALNIILKNDDGVVNQELLNLAKIFLEKETVESITKNKKTTAKKIRHNKPEIIPDCSLCKYYINDRNCEIWRKKPAVPCEEFKIIKNPLTFK